MQVQILGHLPPAEQLTWTQVERSSLRAHTNNQQHRCTHQLLSLKLHINGCSGLHWQTHYFWLCASQPRSWAPADQGSWGRRCSKWDLYAESHSCFESLPKIMFHRACIALPKSSWWMAVSLNLDAEWGSSSEQSSNWPFMQSKRDGIRAFCNQHLLKTCFIPKCSRKRAERN